MMTTKSFGLHLLCALLLSFECCSGFENQDVVVVSSTVQGFNYEIPKRAQEAVNNFLNTTIPPSLQMAVLVAHDEMDFKNITLVRRFLFSQLEAAVDVYALVVVLPDGTVTGYIQTGKLLVDSLAPCGGGSSQSNSGLWDGCLSVFTTNAVGDPDYFVWSIPLSDVPFPLYDTVVTLGGVSWNAILSQGVMNPGLVRSVVLTNSSQIPLGLFSAALQNMDLDTFLHNNFNNDGDRRVVFVINEDMDLVGASVADVSFVTEALNGLLVTRAVKVYECTNDVIRLGGEFLRQLPSFNDTDGKMYIYRDYYIQLTLVERRGFRWHVVVVRPVDPTKDYVQVSSTTFLGVCIAVGVTLLTTVCTAAWIVRYRRMKLWSYAHPVALLLILGCNALCCAFAVVVAIPVSELWCTVRVWLGTLTVASTCAVTLGKATYMFFHDSPLLSKRSKTLNLGLSCVCALVVIVVVSLGVQTQQGSIVARKFYSTGGGDIIEKRECVRTMSELRALDVTVLCLTCALGVVFAFLARGVSESYAESRGLLIVATEVCVLCVGFVCVELVNAVEQGIVVTMMEVLAIVWFVLSVQAILFVPRMFRQLTAGDLTLNELREMIQRHPSNRIKGKQTAS